MKKLVAIMSALCLSVALLAEESEGIKGYHPITPEDEVVELFSHFSIIPHVGFNAFDGDFSNEKKHAISIPTAGLGLEYSFTPVWSVGGEYMFDMYTVTGDKSYMQTADTLLHGMMHKAAAYVSMDFMGLFFPHAKKKVFGLSALLGGGAGWYKNSISYPDDDAHGRGNTLNQTPVAMNKYKAKPFAQFGLNAEFNLNRTLALGIRASYYYFLGQADEIDNRGVYGKLASASKNNDGIFDVTLNMRFKLLAVSRSHERNIGGDDGDLAYRRKVLSKAPAQSEQKPIYIHDTVIIYHDTIHTREIIHTEHTTTNTVTTQVQGRDNGLIFYVYFASGKANIDEDGLVTIQQVADRLKADSSLYAVVTGFCDNTGSNSINYALGDKRAANVLDELREEHGVANAHMYSAGMGKLVGKRSAAAYGPNRRAMIQLVDKAEFDRLRGQLDDKKSHRVADEAPAPKQEKEKVAKPAAQQKQQQEETKLVPIEKSTKPEKVNPYAARPNEEVVVEKSTTLAQLARKYYNNTHCWVYIYIANKQKLPNPNALVPGVHLKIPQLTQEELQTTKDQCLQRFGAARQNKD